MIKIRLLTLLLFAACATTSQGAYLFPRGKQKHEVHVYGKDGKENFNSLSFLILSDREAKITALSPVALTLLKADIKKGQKPELLYLNPALDSQRENMDRLLKKLARLMWIRQGQLPPEIKVKTLFADGSAKEMEWNVASQKIEIKVEML